MNPVYTSVLIRGLCLAESGRPSAVIRDPGGGGQTIPPEALRIGLDSAPGDMDEDRAAALFREAFSAWKAGTGKKAGAVLLPSCAAVCFGGALEGLYWIDRDIDAAGKRLTERNAAPREEAAPAPRPLIAPEDRAAVVKGRIALVSGGAQGIGEEIVRNLAAGGALVFIADLNLEGARKLAEDINAGEKRTAALPLAVNVAEEASVEALFNRTAEIAGGLDLCVSNAGVLKAGSVLDQDLADFKFVTDVNYTGFFLAAKHAGRLLRAQHRCAPAWKTDIIQINSKSGLEGSNKNGAYAGGKFGGIGLTASFAMELVEYNIKVNAICPGNFLDGPLWSHPEKGLFVQYLKTGKVPGAKTVAEVRAFYEAKVPMKRGCTGRDLVRAIYYIVEQEYETGQAIPVTGGQVMLH